MTVDPRAATAGAMVVATGALAARGNGAALAVPVAQAVAATSVAARVAPNAAAKVEVGKAADKAGAGMAAAREPVVADPTSPGSRAMAAPHGMVRHAAMVTATKTAATRRPGTIPRAAHVPMTSAATGHASSAPVRNMPDRSIPVPTVPVTNGRGSTSALPIPTPRAARCGSTASTPSSPRSPTPIAACAAWC